MQSIVKQPLLWMGLGIVIVALIIVSGRFDEVNQASKPEQTDSAGNALPDDALVMDKQTVENKKEAEHAHGANSQSPVNNGDKVIRHQDMLSEDMKQAIRDTLLFHGPMEVIRHPDGSIELPSNGRFTQMPVAVEMPDGSIQIKEYSALPE